MGFFEGAAARLSSPDPDLDAGHHNRTTLGNALGTGALLVGLVAGSTVMLGLAGVALLASGLSAGLQAAEEFRDAETLFREPRDEQTSGACSSEFIAPSGGTASEWHIA